MESEPWWQDPARRKQFERGVDHCCRWLRGAPSDAGFAYTLFAAVDRMGLVQLRVDFPASDPEAPAVFSSPFGGSPHRNPDGSMCLWYPWHPAEQRWEFRDGLRDLVLMAALHLRREDHWRRSASRHADRRWPGPEMPHGFQGDHR